ncbi:MAG: hypothetical protein KAT04_11585 [Methylococcales bacterium]|nr:hypothetical protein [Methylococcales bacterium]
MQYFDSLFITDTETSLTAESNNSFLVDEVFWMTDEGRDKRLYQQLVFKVLRKPKQLLLHIQRIYFTYDNSLSDQLYAALVDLIWVLDGRGEELAKKQMLATQSLLTKQQVGALNNALKRDEASSLLGNKFSLFATGYVGKSNLVVKEEGIAIEHDPLMIAHDFIEYSQLDAAIETLEEAVFDAPDRDELQSELVNLYKVTKNRQAFTKMYNMLIDKKVKIIDEWQQVLGFFGQINEK